MSESKTADVEHPDAVARKKMLQEEYQCPISDHEPEVPFVDRDESS